MSLWKEPLNIRVSNTSPYLINDDLSFRNQVNAFFSQQEIMQRRVGNFPDPQADQRVGALFVQYMAENGVVGCALVSITYKNSHVVHLTIAYSGPDVVDALEASSREEFYPSLPVFQDQGSVFADRPEEVYTPRKLRRVLDRARIGDIKKVMTELGPMKVAPKPEDDYPLIPLFPK